jgi:hypothetical protein
VPHPYFSSSLKSLAGDGHQSYGVYLGYGLANNIYPSATAMDFAFIGGLNFTMAMLVSPLVRIMARYYGMDLSHYFSDRLLHYLSFASHLWHLYLTQGILVGLGIGLT